MVHENGRRESLQIKMQQKALYHKLRGRLGERVIALPLGWLVVAFGEKKQILVSVGCFAVKLLWTPAPRSGDGKGFSRRCSGLVPCPCHGLTLKILQSHHCPIPPPCKRLPQGFILPVFNQQSPIRSTNMCRVTWQTWQTSSGGNT